jgi:hypothetical protein
VSANRFLDVVTRLKLTCFQPGKLVISSEALPADGPLKLRVSVEPGDVSKQETASAVSAVISS